MLLYSSKQKGKKYTKFADMAELADALDSGSSGRNPLQVQILLSAPNKQSGCQLSGAPRKANASKGRGTTDCQANERL